MDKSRSHTVVSGLVAALGVGLLIYMVVVESEPGALPLLLIAAGGGWYLAARFRDRE